MCVTSFMTSQINKHTDTHMPRVIFDATLTRPDSVFISPSRVLPFPRPFIPVNEPDGGKDGRDVGKNNLLLIMPDRLKIEKL